MLTNPNIVFLITDQQRHERHWPAGWSEKNLPTMHRLRRHGLTFHNYITAACECSPSRASMMTSKYPQEHGVDITFSTPLNPALINIARVAEAAGYPTIWKGKWHLSHSQGSTWEPVDITNLATWYGVQQWNPPDAGTSLSDLTTLGGGVGQNDSRFVTGSPAGSIAAQSAIEFIQNYDPATGPFVLVVSLVNPHDVWVYPNSLSGSGYTLDQFQNAGISLPSNFNDDLSTKPAIQLAFQQSYNPLTPGQQQLDYVNLYAWLHTLSDALFGQVMDALECAKLLDDTIIFRFADHGEMGLSHGLQEKMFTSYEEAIHCPLIIHNPQLFPAAVETHALASGLDIAPTVAHLIGSNLTSTLRGRSLVPVIENPSASVRDHVLYTYDDQFPAGSSPPPAQHIRCIRTHRWKYAVTFSENAWPTANVYEYELYDLDNDPGELTNLAYGTVSSENQQKWAELHAKLTQELQVVAALPINIDWPVITA